MYDLAAAIAQRGFPERYSAFIGKVDLRTPERRVPLIFGFRLLGVSWMNQTRT